MKKSDLLYWRIFFWLMFGLVAVSLTLGLIIRYAGPNVGVDHALEISANEIVGIFALAVFLGAAAGKAYPEFVFRALKSAGAGILVTVAFVATLIAVFGERTIQKEPMATMVIGSIFCLVMTVAAYHRFGRHPKPTVTRKTTGKPVTY